MILHYNEALKEHERLKEELTAARLESATLKKKNELVRKLEHNVNI